MRNTLSLALNLVAHMLLGRVVLVGLDVVVSMVEVVLESVVEEVVEEVLL